MEKRTAAVDPRGKSCYSRKYSTIHTIFRSTETTTRPRGIAVAFWSVREELSQFNRLRRSYYELLRDELDQFMLDYALIQSYQQFVKTENCLIRLSKKGSSSPCEDSRH
jgi:hypothetical protein